MRIPFRAHLVSGPAIVGLLAGFLSGMFGIGGGILIVPGLVLFLGMEQRLAHGTSLAAAVPISLSALIGFAVAGEVDWIVSLWIIAGASIGALIGTRALRRLPVYVLRICFAVVLAATAVRLLIHIPDAAGRGPLNVVMVVGLILLGLLSGILAGLLGVGGGIVIVPALVLFWGATAVVAKGTSLAVIVVTAIVGTVQNGRHGNVDARAAAIVGLSGMLSAYGGTLVSLHISGALSNDLFALLLFAVSLQMVRTGRGKREEVPEGLSAEP